MEAIAKHSALNPLASCFVPSIKWKNETKTETVDMSSKNGTEKLKEIMESDTEVKSKIAIVQNEDEKQDAVSTDHAERGDITSSYLLNANERDMKFHSEILDDSWSWLYITILKLLFLALCSFYVPRDLSVTYDGDCEENSSLDENSESPLKENSKSDNECCCPPMFGCIVPPDFFGNPFNLSYSCKRKYVHMRHYSIDENSNTVLNSQSTKYCKLECESLDLEGNLRLEQYSWELEKVVKDICEIISMRTDDWSSLPICDNLEKMSEHVEVTSRCPYSDSRIPIATECGETCKGCFATPVSTRPDFSSSEDLVEAEISKVVVDDDLHPLLDILMDSDDEGVPKDVEKMIEIGLSPPKYEQTLPIDTEDLAENAFCNPPCSVWCDSLPQSAKDTYKKFVKSLKRSEQSSLKSGSAENWFKGYLHKPLYKRSFSANDSVKRREEYIQIQSSFDAESRERLLLCRDSESYFKSYINQSKDWKKTQPVVFYEESNETSLQKFCSEDYHRGMWGPFDGADSLWQPLPDCIPANDPPKSTHRKVREIRRLRSVS